MSNTTPVAQGQISTPYDVSGTSLTPIERVRGLRRILDAAAEKYKTLEWTFTELQRLHENTIIRMQQAHDENQYYQAIAQHQTIEAEGARYHQERASFNNGLKEVWHEFHLAAGETMRRQDAQELSGRDSHELTCILAELDRKLYETIGEVMRFEK